MEAGEAGPTSELLAPPPPPGSSKRTGKRARDGPLLFGTQLIRHEGKEEPSDAAAQGAEAIAAVPWEPPAEKQPAPTTAVQVDKGKLYCSLCSCALTPPIYQCAVGHLACCACRVKLAGSYFFATVPVRSSALADGAGVAPEKELYFAVPGRCCTGATGSSSSPSALIARPGLNLLWKTKEMMITQS